MSHTTLLVSLTLLLASVAAGAKLDSGRGKPIYCYQCNSGVDADCPTLQVNNTNSIHYKPCVAYQEYHGAQPFCRKIVQTIFERDNMVRVIRKCGWEKHPKGDCYSMSNDDHIETVCQCFKDGCNDAGRTTLTVTALTLSLSFVLIS